jgi:hypothetical protein
MPAGTSPALTSSARQLSPPVAAGGSFVDRPKRWSGVFRETTVSRFLENAPTSTPPCRKSKDYHAINLYDDIAPGSVSFHHSLESDLGEHGGFPVLEYVVGSFDETEAVRHDPSLPVGARVAQRQTDHEDCAKGVGSNQRRFLG